MRQNNFKVLRSIVFYKYYYSNSLNNLWKTLEVKFKKYKGMDNFSKMLCQNMLLLALLMSLLVL